MHEKFSTASRRKQLNSDYLDNVNWKLVYTKGQSTQSHLTSKWKNSKKGHIGIVEKVRQTRSDIGIHSNMCIL